MHIKKCLHLIKVFKRNLKSASTGKIMYIISVRHLQYLWKGNKVKDNSKEKINKHMVLPLFPRFFYLFRSHEPVFSLINNYVFNQGLSDHLLFFSLRECSLGLWPNKSYFSTKYCLSHFPTRARLHILNIWRREQYLWKLWNLISTPWNRPFPSIVKQND